MASDCQMGGESSRGGRKGHQRYFGVSLHYRILANCSILAKAGVVEEQEGLQIETYVNTNVAKVV
jgi:hypothetical protein